MTKGTLHYMASGGLAHMLSGLSYAMILAEREGRYLIIDCKRHKAFPYDFSDFFYIKTNLQYSENPKDCTHVDVLSYRGPGPWRAYSKRPFIRGLKVSPSVINKIKSEQPIKERYLSVQFRNTDIKQDINIFIKKIKNAQEKLLINTVYLATDDHEAFDKIWASTRGIRLIRRTEPERVKHNLHYDSKDKRKQIYNCLLDMYFISRSDFFIKSPASGLSMFLIKMKENHEDIFDLEGERDYAVRFTEI